MNKDAAWTLTWDGYDPSQQGLRESLCALGNGYFVTRGAAPDVSASDMHYPGTYVAGGYNRLATDIAGREITNEDLVNLPNWLPLRMRIGDGEWLCPDGVEFLDYRQQLDMRDAVLTRTLRFRDHEGRTTRWEERRFVSLHDQHVAALSVAITPENWSGEVALRSAIDGSVINDGVARYRELNGRHLETVAVSQPHEDVVFLQSRMRQSRREIAEAARTRLWLDGESINPPRRTESEDDVAAQEMSVELDRQSTLLVEKLVTFYTSRDMATTEAGLEARRRAGELQRFDTLLQRHSREWQHLWEGCDLALSTSGNHEVQRTLRLHIFHLLQTVSCHSIDLDIGVPPRGWHGEAYRGHILWDELFIFPFLNLHIPALTRALLQYRWRRLPEARRAARAAGYKGAMFPWQSGSDGREESQTIHLNPQSGRWIPDNSWRQRHIGSAVAWNVWQYYQVTDDYDFMRYFGVELLVEIGRFWASISDYDAEQDRFHIRGVMGPDEFHTGYPDRDPATQGGLDDNAYTNLMAAWVLARALDALSLLPDTDRRILCDRLDLEDVEIAHMETVSHKLYLPIAGKGLILQFAGYDELKEFDWESARERFGDVQRLDRLLEAEGDTPNRYKASKQADVLMLFYLFSSDELSQMFERLGYRVDADIIPRNIDYYLQRTSHGSTLSWVVHSWVLARSDRQHSWSMFREALRSDVEDIQGGTTAEGIHLGAMAGTVDIVQRCYTGIEMRENALHINPSLPDELDCLRTCVRYRQHILELEIDHETLRVSSRLVTAAPVLIAYRGHVRKIGPGQSHEFRLVNPRH